MTNIIIRDLRDEEYFKLLKMKKNGNYDTWRKFFVDKLDLPQESD
jgi:hypothetical protein